MADGAHPGAGGAGAAETSRTSSPAGRRTGTSCALTGPDLPGLAEHLDEAAALAARFAEVAAGSTVVHTDIRDDNLLLTRRRPGAAVRLELAGRRRAWLDTVFLMIGPRGDGLDVDALLAASPLTRDVPAESIDVVIALVTGYFLMSAAQPVPPTSPYIRDAQRWQGEVCWGWLASAAGGSDAPGSDLGRAAAPLLTLSVASSGCPRAATRRTDLDSSTTPSTRRRI